jgi:hypothetical protein
MLLTVGQAVLQGEYFSANTGRLRDHEPVLNASVDDLDMGMISSGSRKVW